MFSQQVIIAVVTVGMLYSAIAQDQTKCKGSDITMSDKNMMNVMSCLNSSGATTINDLPKEQKGCFTKCVMLKQGLVDDTGMLKKDNISSSLATGIPDSVKGPLTTQIGQCFDQAGTVLDMSDKSCAAFAPVCDCIRASYTSLCS